MANGGKTDFSALSDDLLLLILDKISANCSSFRPHANFQDLAAFSCVSRRCARWARARGWERACRIAFPAVNKLIPELSSQAEKEADGKTATEHKWSWVALAKLLSCCPGHGVNEGEPFMALEGCNPKALVVEPFSIYPFQLTSEWERILARGAEILGPWIDRETSPDVTPAAQVFLHQEDTCIIDEFMGNTGTYRTNCVTLFWGFVVGLDISHELVNGAVSETTFVCPFCPSSMWQLPLESVARGRYSLYRIYPTVSYGTHPHFFVCQGGHLYGVAATDSDKCRYNDSWTCSGCGGRRRPGHDVSDVLARWARERGYYSNNPPESTSDSEQKGEDASKDVSVSEQQGEDASEDVSISVQGGEDASEDVGDDEDKRPGASENVSDCRQKKEDWEIMLDELDLEWTQIDS